MKIVSQMWELWQVQLKNSPRASLETILVLFLLFCLLFYFQGNPLFLFLALALLASSCFQRIRDAIAFIWWSLGIHLGKLTSPIVLAVLYFLFLTPWGLLFRLFNPDPLLLKKREKSLWREKKHSFSANDFDNPF